jgi:hypothetical protein
MIYQMGNGVPAATPMNRAVRAGSVGRTKGYTKTFKRNG